MTSVSSHPSKRKRSDIQYNVPTQNSFSVFSDDDDDEMDLEAASNSHELAQNSKTKSLPPIIVNRPFENYTSIISNLNKNLSENINIKYKKHKTIFITYNNSDFQKVQEELKKHKIEFHTYTPESDIKPKYLLRGIPPNMDTEEIKSDLISQGLKIYKIFQMVKKKEIPNEKLPIWVITLEDKAQIQIMLKIRVVCHIVIKWDKYKVSKLLTQCFNCQEYNHISTNCFKNPKCKNCSEGHPSNTCPKINDENFIPICSNCNQAHFSNFEKCPVYEKNLELKLSKKPRIVPLKPSQFKHQDFPSLPKTSAKWPQGTFENRENKSTSLTDFFKEIKSLFNSVKIPDMINTVKTTLSKMKYAEDGMTKVFILIEGIISLFD